MIEGFEASMRAVRSRDSRFDGWFVTCVPSTGIYCRPSCPAATPKPAHVQFLPTPAAAQAAGFRACRRCRPDAAPGSPEWDSRADVAARAMRLIAHGLVDRDGVSGLAGLLGYSVRQVERLLVGEVGVGPLALARAQRAQTARLLVETTSLPMADVAFAAGFASVRQFNDTVRAVFATTPTALRRAAAGGSTRSAGTIVLRLPYRPPFCPDNLFGHLVATAVPGVEEWRGAAYRRTIRLAHSHGVVCLAPEVDHVVCRLRLGDLRDVGAAVARCRRLLDLDADPVAIDDVLAADPVLRSVVRQAPGRRVPRTVDAGELAVRAVLGQQVSTAAARTHTARLVRTHGEQIDDPEGGLTHLFPEVAAVAEADPDGLAIPRSRRRALLALANALARGEVDLGPGADWSRSRSQLAAIPGVGPWTVETVAMRGLGDPDAFPPGDLGVRAAAATLGLPASARALEQHSRRWSPWRSYAVQHLWATGDHAINRLPASDVA